MIIRIISPLALALVLGLPPVQPAFSNADACRSVELTSKTVTGLDLELSYLHEVELDIDVISAVLDAAGQLTDLGEDVKTPHSPTGLKNFSEDFTENGTRLRKAALLWSYEGMVNSIRSAGESLDRASSVCKRN